MVGFSPPEQADPTILQTIRKRVQALGERPCIHFKKEGRWHTRDWLSFSSDWMDIAKGLMALGVERGDRVALIASPSYDWTLADLASLTIGAIVVPIYPSLPKEQISAIFEVISPKLVFVESQASDNTVPPHPLKIFFTSREGGNDMDSVVRTGASVSSALVDDRLHCLASSDHASYIPTSGTTGKCKLVVTTHGAIAAEIAALRPLFAFGPDDIGLLCLPLSHVLGRMTQFYHLTQGIQTAYAESIPQLAQNYREVRPHLVAGVPRMLEKMQKQILQKVALRSYWQQKLFWSALAVGKKWERAQQQKRKPSPFLAVSYFFARRVVFRKILDALGGRLHSFICGGAPLAKDCAEFFVAIGLSIYEGYGLTETFAAITVNRPADYKLGTVGKPLPGVTIRIADDGEILAKGPMVFHEYLQQPQETGESFDGAGWFKTGDIGVCTEDGFLSITDRKKELIVTAGGKKIAPQRLETLLTEYHDIEMAFVFGDRHPYLVALLVVAPGTSFDLIREHVREVNGRLARFETIKRFALLHDPFSVDNGQLTPTLKLRRKVIAETYKARLEDLYRPES